VVVAVCVITTEGGIGEVAVQKRCTAACLCAENTVATVEGVGVFAVNRGNAIAACATSREIAHHAIAINTSGCRRKAV